MKLSVMQVYNETVQDLLQPGGPTLNIYDKKGDLVIPDLLFPVVGGAEDAIEKILEGNMNRKVRTAREGSC